MTIAGLIEVHEAYELVKAGKARFVDVREPCEFNSKRIDGAKNISASSLKKEMLSEIFSSDTSIILYCLSGRRSDLAKKDLEKSSKAKIYSMVGGITAWEQAGLPIKIIHKEILPLDRQTQIAIGLMIIIGLIIGIFVSPYGFVLPAIAGFGLINAGMTGWCGLLQVISKMPWNKTRDFDKS